MSKKIKLFDLAKQANVGMTRLSEELKKRELVDNPTNPNARLDLPTVEILLEVFKRDIPTEVATSLRTTLKGESVQASAPKAETKEAEPTKHEFKPIGKIDLDAPKKKPEANKVKAEAKPKIEAQAEASAKPKVAPIKVEAQTQAKTEPAKAVETPQTQPKVAPATKAEEAPATAQSEASKSVEPAPEVKASEKPAQGQTPAEKQGENLFRASAPDPGIKFNVVGKIDLDSLKDNRPKKKEDKKRKRVKTGAVDVKAEAIKAGGNNNNQGKKSNTSEQGNNKQSKPNAQGNGGKQNAGRQPNAEGQGQGRKARRQKEQQKPAVTEEDVQRQVKETLARLSNNKNSGGGAKYRKEKRTAIRNAAEEARAQDELESKTLKLSEFVTVSDLASLMDVPVTQVISTCMSIGLIVSINMRLDAETIEMVAEEFGFSTDFVAEEVNEAIAQEEDDEADLVPRPPIVTVMGHVDHGKTSLLDRLRNSNVIEGEAGGITQHIGAYSLKLQNGKRITFLDTPGHEAFTAMRARGAKLTDIVIIIVAADDDVMPQTKEAINHAAAAGVPMIFAINKIDKPGANPDRIREQLAAMNYLVEEWGGKYQCQEISAKQGINIDELLEKVLLEAELLELKANPNRRAVGSIIESSLDKGRGYVAKVMVQNGTLSNGDVILAGTNYGKVKAMFNERNQRVTTAGPSTPVLVLGLDGAPGAGETFNAMETEQEARSIASKREQLKREQDSRTKKGLTLEELARRRALGNFQELNVIIKGDVDGSIEALSDSLIRLSTEEIQVNVIHKGVGAISESDVVLASASSAIILGFQVRPSQAAKRQADREGVEIRTYSIIYDTIEDIKSAMEGMLSPEIKENVVANLEVRETFKITKVGTVAGCIVIEGKIKRNNKIRLIRDGIVKYAGALGSLKRFKDDAKEVVMGQECGLNIDGYNDIMVGDIIEAYEEIEIKKTLDFD